MKAQALPEPIQSAANELEAAATQREMWNSIRDRKVAQAVVAQKIEESGQRLHKARVELAAAINAECARQFEAGIATAGGKAG